MRKILFVAVTALTLAVLVPANPATAAPPTTVSIVVTETAFVPVGGGEGLTGTFSSTGFCPGGTGVSFTTVNSAGPIGATGVTKIDADKRLVCDDGSGALLVNLNVRLYPSGDTTAKWKVTGGTVDYAGAKGHGDLVGVPIVVGSSITDTYTGKLK